jgi:hypothetical protein
MPAIFPPDDWIETALKLTGSFESSGDPFGGVTGDFDHQGISLGVLQWNIGQGSLQPLVRNVGQAVVSNYMPTYGADMWQACNSTIASGLHIARTWQSGSVLRAPVKAELKRFARSPEFRNQQVAAARNLAGRALDDATGWAAQPSKRLFCWFFDLRTQNGGLKTVTQDGVKDFIDGQGSTNVDDTICDWLAARTSADAGFKDSHRNADLWRNAVPDERLVMFVASFLRCRLGVPAYQGDVLNRKGTIAIGSGWVHGEQRNLIQI